MTTVGREIKISSLCFPPKQRVIETNKYFFFFFCGKLKRLNCHGNIQVSDELKSTFEERNVSFVIYRLIIICMNPALLTCLLP
jgi:hypothetical protein